MDAYLLDTNIVSHILSPKSPFSKTYRERLDALGRGGNRIMLPVVAIAEVEEGLQRGSDPHSAQAQEIRRWIAGYPHHLPFDDNSVQPYALLRAELIRRYGPEKAKRGKKIWVEDLCDRISGKTLGVDERDLLIASVAIQYNCVLVTRDRMNQIRDVADSLRERNYPTELRVQHWEP